MASLAFAVDTAAGAFVLRIAASDDGFRKDATAHSLFAGAGVPVPPVVATGAVDECWHYAIAPRCVGTRLSALTAAQLHTAREAVLDLLEALVRVDVTARAGWGPADAGGTGRCESWSAFLGTAGAGLSEGAAERARGSSGKPSASAEFARWREEMLGLARFCPAGRWLVHGDFAPDNVIVDGARVTGLIDWAEFGYGDFLYDLATLEFHDPSGDWAGAWRRRMVARGAAVPAFEERLRCCLLHIGLAGMTMLSARGQTEDFHRVHARMRAIARRQGGAHNP